MATVSFRINNNVDNKLKEIIKKNNYSNRSDAIKNCIDIAYNLENNNLFLQEMDKKINRIIHNVSVIRKMLEQLFSNNGFRENRNVKDDLCLQEFYEKNNSFRNNFLE